MKTFQVIAIVLAAMIASCSAPNKEAPVETKTPAQELEGVWKITYGKYTYPDTAVEITDFAKIKILVGGRFAHGNQDTDSTLTAGGGTYEYDGQTYTENIEYFSMPSLVGQSVKFDISLEEGEWPLSGTIRVDDEDIKLEEVWERVE